jgi:hypothetical protein
MKIYNVGPDELSEWDFSDRLKDGYVWFVYFYEEGSYEGSGEAVALREDGTLDLHNLGHCSCYGPMEEWPSTVAMSVEEFVRPKDSIWDYEAKDAVFQKVQELLKETSVFDDKFNFLGEK